MSKIATVGKRTLEGDTWHDANGPIPGYPDQWDPPMTDAERRQAALADPDNPPMSRDRLEKLRGPSLAKLTRERLQMSRDEFALAFGIPLDTLRRWERHEVEPTPAELSLLRTIAAAPDTVRAALQGV